MKKKKKVQVKHKEINPKEKRRHEWVKEDGRDKKPEEENEGRLEKEKDES